MTGPASSGHAPGHALPVGTRIGEVEIVGLVGEGGFGIVYLAHDPTLQRRVAVKEYMPTSLASRTANGLDVAVKSERLRETFEAGLKSFVNEARLLARFDHPALVKVYRFWQANGTACMMMPYYEGPTLKAALDQLGHAPDETTLRGWLAPLLDALDVIHASRCFHRDIAPDNILLTANGPLLLDFGAARRVIGDMTQALTVVLKPGYAPIEQYGESARMQQGAWTDLYALGCVVHYAITGRAPMSSVERLMDDTLQPLSRVAAGSYSAEFLRAVDAALALRPQHRPQDVAQFRALMGPDPTRPPPRPAAPVAARTAASPSDGAAPAPSDGAAPAPADGTASPTAAPASPSPKVDIADLPLSIPERHVTTSAIDRLVPEIKRTRSRLAAAAGVAGALAVALGLWWFAIHRPTAPTPPRPAATSHEAPAIVSPPPVAGSAGARPSAVLPSPPLPLSPLPDSASSSPPATPRSGPRTRASGSASTAGPGVVPASIRPSPANPSMPASSRTTPSAPSPARSPRCTDILQKASIEALSADDTAFLKRECR